ncbi:MAG: glycerol-3-phosphate acyltransferase [Chloroflexota bacterium]
MSLEQVLLSGALILVGYLLGSLPMGYIFLKLLKHQDITRVGSGRTGGTNAMRAGGVWMGVLTGLADFGKGFLAVSLARLLTPDLIWVQVLCGFAAVAGHNWSLWLYLWTRKLSAGAGTGPNVGAAMAFWTPVALIVIPIVIIFVFIVGYASLASIAAALAIVAVFFVRASTAGAPWEYGIYGILTMLLVIWALRPNIKRLVEGTERRVGIFAKKTAA